MKKSRRDFLLSASAAALLVSYEKAFSWPVHGIYFALAAPQLVLTSSSATPGLSFNFVTMPLPGDILKVYDSAVLLGSYTMTQTDMNNGSFNLGLPALGSGTHHLTAEQWRSSGRSGPSNSVTVVV